MEHTVELMPCERIHHDGIVTDVATDDFDFSAEVGEVVLLHRWIVVIVKIVEDHHIVTGRDESLAKVGADEARATRDEDFFGRILDTQGAEKLTSTPPLATPFTPWTVRKSLS